MGTRGVLGFVADGTPKITYNHWDSYPDGLGNDVLGWLRGVVASSDREKRAAEAVVRMRAVSGEPTDAERKVYAQAGLADASVSTGDDWYSLLRNAQGDPAKLLDVGVYDDASDFPLDSLFCEWAYVIDFDKRVFEVYKGFRTDPPTKGRWAGNDHNDNGYYAVQLVVAYSFDRLPLALDEDALERAAVADEDACCDESYTTVHGETGQHQPWCVNK